VFVILRNSSYCVPYSSSPSIRCWFAAQQKLRYGRIVDLGLFIWRLEDLQNLVLGQSSGVRLPSRLCYSFVDSNPCQNCPARRTKARLSIPTIQCHFATFILSSSNISNTRFCCACEYQYFTIYFRSVAVSPLLYFNSNKSMLHLTSR
jgi:hypothetical protein